jgi:hypothetical protein
LQNFFSILQLALKCKTVDEINFRDVKFSRLISLQNFFSHLQLLGAKFKSQVDVKFRD